MYSEEFIENPVKFTIDLGFKGRILFTLSKAFSLRQERTKICNANIRR